MKLQSYSRIYALFVLSFLCPLLGISAEFYVSPTGSSSGNGTQLAPWDLTTALTHPAAVRPGDTIWLRGGLYNAAASGKSAYRSTLTGEPKHPIIIRQYPGERAIIDGINSGAQTPALQVDGAWTWFWGFEITNSFPSRSLNLERNHAVEVYGPNTKLINLTIYDNGQGIGFWKSAVDSEAYGNLVFNNGWIAQDHGHGHGVYTQNSTGLKTFRNNILLQQFGYTFHAYDANAELNRYLLDRNSLFGGSILVGGQQPARDITVENNRFYQTDVELGPSSSDNADLQFNNNYIAGAVALRRWSNAQMIGNTIYPVQQDSQSVTLDVTFRPTVGMVQDYQLTNNAYFKGPGRGGSDFTFLDTAGVLHNSTFPVWQQAGFDLNSTYHSNSPSNVQVFLERNQYEPERAHVTVYNWPRQPVVQVNLSSLGLQVGDVLELSNAFNYFTETTLITYDGGPVAIRMTGWTVAMPLGYLQPLTASPFPEFGVFVLRKMPRGVSVNVNPRSATLKAGQQQQLTASIAGTGNSGIVWNVSPAMGSVSPSGLYTAPAAIASETTVVVTATSATDSTQSATCTIRLLPNISVILTPANAIAGPGSTQLIDVQVSGTSDDRVIWTMQPIVGTLSSSGQYTAPASITKQQMVTITAASVVDPTQSGSTAMTLLPGAGGSVTLKSSTGQFLPSGLLAAAPSSVGQALAAATTTGLVGYWSLDESSGNTAADSSGKGYNGTLVNSPARTNGKINRALSLNGTSQIVNVGASSAFNLTGDMTASAWVNHIDSNGADVVLGKGGCYSSFCPFGIRIDSGDNVCFSQANGTSGQDAVCTTGARVTLGQWVHIAVVRSGAQRSIYINGSLAAASSTRTKAPTANSAPLLIGNSASTESDYFNGAVDEVRIYNRALTAAEIAGIYNDNGSGSGSTPPPSDVTPPVISSIVASGITGIGAAISWTTNELSDTQVEYGTTTAYGKVTSLATLVNAHSATLSGLTAGTTYNYRVKSRDAAGNTALSSNQTFTTTSSTTPPPPSPGATTTGLVGYWSLNESSGNTAADSSGKGYHGTLVNSPARTNGKINGALSLNGTSQIVNVGASSAFNLTGDMTASAWVNHIDSNGADVVLGKGGCYSSFCPFGIRIDGGDNVCFSQANGTSGQDAVCTTGARVTLGQWVHIAVVRSGAQRSIYINGSLAAASSTRTKAPTANSAPLLIGNSASTESDYFNGAVDEVRIYNRALTAAEIAGIYNDNGSGSGSTPPPSDVTPPVISSIVASGITGSGAAISWTTNELSDTQVEYGTTTAYGQVTSLATLVNAHSATLSGLTAGTTYNYRVKSRDAAGNTALSSNQTLTTTSSTTPPPPPTSGGNQWYASTNGTSSGNGSQASPWNLVTALNGGRGLVKPGDTVWVRGGTYKGRFASTMSGTAQQPIIIRAYPNERVTIDGRFETSVTASVPSGSPNSTVSIPVTNTSGFAGNMPNAHMSVRLEYTPSGSTNMVEETLLVLSVGSTTLSARRGACTQFGGTCPSFPAGARAVATDVEYLRAYGAYTWIWGLEVMYSQDNHVMGGPLWPNFQGAVAERCTGCKFINMIIHDSGSNGVFSGAAGQGTEIYGSLIYYNGADDLAGRAHGHGVYGQNTQNGPTKYIIDNFFFRSFQFGNQIYGSSSTYLDNFHVEGNTYFKAGEPTHEFAKGQFIIGDAGVFKNHVFKDNMMYATADVGIDIGYGGLASSPECKSPVITGNYLVHTANDIALKVTCSTPTITGNTILGKLRDITASAYPNNTYLTSLSGQKIFVRPNKYETGRANVTIFNWSKAPSASVDVSKIGLASGDRYEVRDVQNYFGPPVASGTYNGSAITVPMNNTAVAQPIGKIAVAPIKHTSSEFNAFVIVKMP